MKRSVDDLALFGGTSLFTSFRPTSQLANKGADQFFVYAREAFDRRRLTNHGPLVEQLETSLKSLHNTAHCVTFSNACMAIMVTLRVLANSREGNVVLPAMSYRGLPHLVRWAGLTPKYCDIDPVRHTLEPKALSETIDSKTVAVLAVDNVNAMCDVDAIEAITNSRGVPLLLDSVHGIGGKHGADICGTRGAASIFTLHATKLINGFEGGYATTNDAALAARLGASANFGFRDMRDADMLGVNAKLNELHAALALANLPFLDEIRAENKRRFEAYEKAFVGMESIGFADYAHGPGNYSLILMKIGEEWPFSRAEMLKILNAENALARAYYSPTIYEDDIEFRAGSSKRFPNADKIGREFLQMPMGEMTSIEDISSIATLFAFLHSNSAAIAERLRD